MGVAPRRHDSGHLTTLEAAGYVQSGEVGCWPLMARITPTGNLVVRDAFEQPHRRSRDYAELGPLLFDRDQYDVALKALCTEIAATEQ